MSIVALFSTKEELEILLNREDYSELSLIALSAEGDFWAEKYGIIYQTKEDICDEFHLYELGKENDRIVLELCASIDQNYLKNSNITAQDNFFLFKYLFDSFFLNLHYVKYLMKKINPKKVIFFTYTKEKNNYNNMLSCFSSIFNKILICYMCAKNINFENFENYCCNNSQINYERKNIIKTLHFYLSNLKNKFINCFLNLKNYSQPLILIAQHYDFEVCKKLNEFFRVCKLNEINISKNTSETDVSDIDVKILESFFKDENGISFLTSIEKSLQENIYLLKYEYKEWVAQFEYVIKKKSISCVIAAVSFDLNIIAAIRAGHNLGIPVIWGQHGGFYGYAKFPLHDFTTMLYSHFFIYGEKVKCITHDYPSYVLPNVDMLAIYKKMNNDS